MSIKGCTTIAVFLVSWLISINAHAAQSTIKIPAGATVKIDGNSAMISGGGGGIIEGDYSCSCMDNAGGSCKIVRVPSSMSCVASSSGSCKSCVLQTMQGKAGGAAMAPPSGTSKGSTGLKTAPPAGKKQ